MSPIIIRDKKLDKKKERFRKKKTMKCKFASAESFWLQYPNTDSLRVCVTPGLLRLLSLMCFVAASESGWAKKPQNYMAFHIALVTCLVPHRPSHQPTLSQLGSPNPINIFYAHSFFLSSLQPHHPSPSSSHSESFSLRSSVFDLKHAIGHPAFSSLLFLQVSYTSYLSFQQHSTCILTSVCNQCQYSGCHDSSDPRFNSRFKHLSGQTKMPLLDIRV